MNKWEMTCRVNDIAADLSGYGYDVGFDESDAFYIWRVCRSDGSIVELVYDGGEEFDVVEYDDANAYSVEDVRTSHAYDIDTNPAKAFFNIVEGK